MLEKISKKDKKLSKNFVETIAGQWKRLKIETAIDAMNQAEKEYKKMVEKIANRKAKLSRGGVIL